MDPEQLTRARAPFDRMRTELMAGQYLDVLAQAVTGTRPEQAVERARRVIRYKSAKYTVERAAAHRRGTGRRRARPAGRLLRVRAAAR